jgi:glutathione synthase/RimK-type ligase-like ATP-grasp enzyme
MHVNLANALAADGAWEASRASYERALARDPEHAIAHYALALLLARRDAAAASAHRARAFATPIVHVRPSNADRPLRVLVPYAADGGNLVTTHFFDRDVVETIAIAAESYTDGALPAHDAICNAVADADRSTAALDAVERIVAASGRPCINAPAAVRATGRADVAARLARIPNVVTPRTLRVARADCTPAVLAAAGFSFPLLLRTPGFHTGLHFVRVARPEELAPQLDALPGDDVLVIAFVDTRDRDGRYRKYRMLIVDGRLVPIHVASARYWKVHYFSADNAVRAASRDVERAWLADPRAHSGDRAYGALERVRDALALDYGGIDFALGADGDVVVFEANASFAIYLPDDDATASYRLPAASAAITAVRAMIRERALRGRAMMREDGTLDHREDLRPA